MHPDTVCSRKKVCAMAWGYLLPYELHIFQHGPHGYSLANETTSDGSSRYMNAAFAQWQGLSVEWLHKIFGPLEYVEKNNSKMGKYLKEMGLDLPGFCVFRGERN